MKTIGIYSSQFQPPHKGHYEAYKRLRKVAGPDTFVVTTDYDPTLEAALHFGDKEQLLVRHGIPASHIRQVKNLLDPKEILHNYDPNTTVVILAVNGDTARKLMSKSNHYKTIDFSGNHLKPFKDQIYILTVDDSKVGDKIYSSKNIREALGSHRFTNKQKEKWFKHFFGWFDLGLFELLKNKYTNAHQSDVFTPPPTAPIKEELANEIRKIVNELSFDNSTGTDEMPTVDNMADNNADAQRDAQKEKQNLVTQKRQSERDLKSLETDRDWKQRSLLSLRKDNIPNKRKEIDSINRQLTNPVPTSTTTTTTTGVGY